ncbi:hypothetical protein [Candidatus Nitronereus thalassa]|uniref:Uncharacterized protein n=1 Tax=Candidatus Nitronereus thalassa TaxID=3020898 RepID=A0ABU3K4C0_9BACT|nr:hypothetical protein [Candidatus Nitronereus thalassa]MDT7041231.1 hypothetical protein [Candidatus Nitronereus thalassa]
MSDPENQEGKRIGIHPLIVIFGVIIGLWIFIQAIIPKSKDIQPPQGHETQAEKTATILQEAKETNVPTFKMTAAVPSMNALSLLVPGQTTDSQVVALLLYLRDSRRDGTLSSLLPATTPDNELGQFSIANIYIFSDPNFAVKEAITILSVGAHAPGDIYGKEIPYEVAMKHVRGQYVVNLNNKDLPEKGSLGYSEEATGLYSRRYLPIF